MQAKRVTKNQQLQYIIECRTSGLTDYQWCKEHGIHPGTFYNWVSKLKKAGCQDIPDPLPPLARPPKKQEIVRLEVAPEEIMVDNLPKEMEQNACLLNEPTKDSVVEVILPNATIRFVNSTDTILFDKTLNYLGGMPC